MREDCITKLKQLNDDLITKYLGTSHVPNVIQPCDSPIPHVNDTVVPTCGVEYYDLMIVNLLMYRHYSVTCTLTANIAEIVANMAQEGLVRTNVMTLEEATIFTTDIVHNRIPKRSLMWKYLSFIERYDHNVLPYWFYYTLLLWVFVDSKRFDNSPTLSRYFVGLIHCYGLTQFTDHNADRNHDVFDVREKLLRLIYLIMKDERYEDNTETMILHLIDSLRVFGIITFSSILSRSCIWNIFKPIGAEVLHQRLVEHQSVVNMDYKQYNRKEQYCEQTGSKQKSYP